MQLAQVKIHNFRGILDQEVSFKDYSLLVGANNSGKTTVIDAIRAFYEKDGYKYKGDNDFPLIKTTDKESWIEITYLLTVADKSLLADEYKNDSLELCVRKYFQTTLKTSDGKSANGVIFGYKADATLSLDAFYGAKNAQTGKFGDIIYIPAISKVDDHAKLSGPSALRDLLSDILSDVVKDGEAYQEFSSSVRTFAGSVAKEETVDKRSLQGFEKELTTLLEPWDVEFKLKFPPPSAAEIIKTMLNWDLIDQFHGESQTIENYGSGFQRHFIYSLIQLGSRYVKKKTDAKEGDFKPTLVLLLFEEPEAFLHPPQQEILARSLMSLAEADDWQVVCATHSSHFVSRNTDDIPAIAHSRRSKDGIKIFQIDELAWNAIVGANQEINKIAENWPDMKKRLEDDDMKAEMEAIKLFLWLNPDRSSMFFADNLLLVEGQTEVAFINKLIGDKKINNGSRGLYVLDCLGKYNMHRFMNLLKPLGIPHAVLYDDDENKDHHKEVNQLIKSLEDPNLTIAIEPVPGNLEKMLGVKTTAPHRKPQHLLFIYESGQIDDVKLGEFCKLVESCLPSEGG